MKVYVLRGGSGSGKSTWAQKHGDIIVSADSFFLDENEVYQFDFDKLGEAHDEAFRKFLRYIQNPPASAQELRLVVDNTNTRIYECAPYVMAAETYGHDVKVMTLCYDPIEAFKRNIHESSLDVCMKQHVRLMEESNRIPSWWEHEFILADG